jgi:hypothetical protein
MNCFAPHVHCCEPSVLASELRKAWESQANPQHFFAASFLFSMYPSARKETTMTECPQCGAMNEDDVKNCVKCRINMYWVFQHYQELAAIQESSKLAPSPQTPSFLIETSQKVDTGPTAGWLHKTIKKFGFIDAGKKVSTMS